MRAWPTCGPLPWTTAMGEPLAAISARKRRARRRFFLCAATPGGSPARSSACPPRATTSPSGNAALPEEVADHVVERGPAHLLELVAHAAHGRGDPDVAPEVGGRGHDHHVGPRRGDRLLQLPE